MLHFKKELSGVKSIEVVNMQENIERVDRKYEKT